MRAGKSYVNIDGDVLCECDTFVYTVDLFVDTLYGFNLIHSARFAAAYLIPEITQHITKQNGDVLMKEYTLYGAPKEYLNTHGFVIVLD